MKNFKIQFQEIKQALTFDDYNFVIKRVIDLTLDTENIIFYKKTYNLLSWLDYNQSNITEKSEKLSSILDELYQFLTNEKQVTEYKLLLEAENLKKAYSNSFFALGPISIKIHEGEIIGLVGENGNGKTTLLRSLCKELQLTEGEITYNFNYTDDYDLRSKLIYIPQRTPVLYGTLLDNLKFTASSYGIKAENNELIIDLIISRMGLRDYKNFNWKNLSSGYKMRFELARVLLRKPKLLLIDEPLANLDILAQQTVLDDFKAIAKSTFRPLGIVLSSQQLYEVEKNSDQVIFLKHGTQKNLNHKRNTEIVKRELIIEFESDKTLESLYKILSSINVIKIHLNGGTFIASFPDSVSVNEFLKTIIEQNISLKYFRNISNSTRRFFI